MKGLAHQTNGIVAMVLVVILDDRPRHKAATCTTLKWIDIRTKQNPQVAYNLNKNFSFRQALIQVNQLNTRILSIFQRATLKSWEGHGRGQIWHCD